jgi:hypothetical protein
MEGIEAQPAMGWLDSLKAVVSAIDTEYERRIRSASNVREYNVGGHGAHNGNGHHDAHEQLEAERLGGEGGVLGDLQSNAGPQTEPPH